MSDEENSPKASKDIFIKSGNEEEEEPVEVPEPQEEVQVVEEQEPQEEVAEANDEAEEEKIVTKEFQEAVIEFVKLDDKARKLGKQMKHFKQEKKQYEDIILNFMETNKENVIEITGGKLRINKATTKAPLKHETIQSTLAKKFKDTKKAFEITNLIVNDRPMVERRNLKRTGTKGEKVKKKTKVV